MKRLRSIVVGMFLVLAAAVPGFAVDGVLSGVISTDEGRYKDIYGSYIVWTANSRTIKLYNQKDSQTSIIGQGNYPRIYKENVVWVDFSDVFKYDIKSGTTTIIGNSLYNISYPPSIHGSKIVWSDNIEIRVYDIFSGQTTVLPVSGAYPVVYENMLTYLDTDDRDVHLYDMVRGVDTIIGTQNGMFYQALIDDSYIYWEGYDGSNYYTINRYDVSNNIALPQVPICGSPSKFAISDGKVYFDGNCGGPQHWRVREFDPKTGIISTLIVPTEKQPWAPAVYGNKVVFSYSPDGLRTFDITSPSEEVYSVNATANPGTVTVINPYKADDPTTTEDDRIVATISTGAGPSDTALSPDETKLYILNSTDKTATIAQTYDYDFVPYTVNINPTNKQTIMAVAGDNDSNTYVALKNSTGAGLVKKITSAGVATTLTVGTNPNGLKISPDNKKLLVSNGSSSNVTAIDLATFTIIEGNIATGAGPKIVRP